MSEEKPHVENHESVPLHREHVNEIHKRYLSEDGMWVTQVREAINSCVKKEPPKTLWHYCSTQGLEGIISSEKIFMGDINRMNDHKEGKWLMENIKSKLSVSGHQFLSYLNSTYPSISFLPGPFVLSLSEDGDLLSQWRAYANGGKGVALGFDTSRLEIPIFTVQKEQQPGYIALSNVIYDPEVQELVTCKIVSIIEEIVKYTQGFHYEKNFHPYLFSSAYINMYLHYIEPLFKNPAFKEEQEWRIIFFPQSSMVGDAHEISLSDDVERKSIRFRFREDDIIPYFLFPQNRNIQGVISRIMLGPLCNMEKNILGLYLNHRGVSGYSIERSSATLR